MQTLSRRSLARYAANSMVAGVPSAEIARHLGAALIETKKTKQLAQLIEDIAYELEERKLAAHAQITTAHVIDEQIRKQIENFIAKQTGAKQVTLSENLEPALIGGIHIETAKLSWDETIRRKLTDIGGAF